MARRNKISGDELVSLINNYFNEMRFDINSLKFTSISRHLKQKGYNIEDYDIRRNEIAVNHINKLRKSENSNLLSSSVVYKTLDIDKFIENNNSLISLKSALVDRDNYYSHVCEMANTIATKYKSLVDKFQILTSKYEKIKDKCEMLEINITEKNNEIKQLKSDLLTMNNILKTNVYPEIANELLRENDLLKGGKSIISQHGKENIISENDSITDLFKNNKLLNQRSTVIQELFDKI